MPAAKSLGYTDLSSMDPENNSSGKFGNWLRLSMMELRRSGYNATMDRNAMNVHFVENQPVRTDKIGLYKDGAWYLDKNGNGVWDGPVIDSAPFFGITWSILRWWETGMETEGRR